MLQNWQEASYSIALLSQESFNQDSKFILLLFGFQGSP